MRSILILKAYVLKLMLSPHLRVGIAINTKTLCHVCWKPQLWSQQRKPLLGNGSANTPVARQWLGSRHVMAATDMQATVEELLEVFPVRSVPRLYKEDQLSLGDSLERAVESVLGWCEMAASLWGREPWKTLPRRAVSPWLRTLVFVWFVKCSYELYVKVSNKSNYQSKPRL
jgi:hypothetical protein